MSDNESPPQDTQQSQESLLASQIPSLDVVTAVVATNTAEEGDTDLMETSPRYPTKPLAQAQEFKIPASPHKYSSKATIAKLTEEVPVTDIKHIEDVSDPKHTKEVLPSNKIASHSDEESDEVEDYVMSDGEGDRALSDESDVDGTMEVEDDPEADSLFFDKTKEEELVKASKAQRANTQMRAMLQRRADIQAKQVQSALDQHRSQQHHTISLIKRHALTATNRYDKEKDNQADYQNSYAGEGHQDFDPYDSEEEEVRRLQSAATRHSLSFLLLSTLPSALRL